MSSVWHRFYWHSVEKGCWLNHVADKVKMCEKLGIKLIVIWEDNFLRDKRKVFDFIDSVFNNPKLAVDDLTEGGTKETFEADRQLFNKAWDFPGYELIGGNRSRNGCQAGAEFEAALDDAERRNACLSKMRRRCG